MSPDEAHDELMEFVTAFGRSAARDVRCAHPQSSPTATFLAAIALAVREMADRIKELEAANPPRMPKNVEQFFNQIIEGDFCADNPRDLRMALEARSSVCQLYKKQPPQMIVLSESK